MPTKLSHSQISLYGTCGERYRRHYIARQRSVFFHAALAFGSAVDNGLNALLETKDLSKANATFEQAWFKQFVNGKLVELPKFENLVYAESDFDEDLLFTEDYQLLGCTKEQTIERIAFIRDQKKAIGLKNLSLDDRQWYNYCNWLCMKTKGLTMLASYKEKVLPKINRVISVQHKTSMVNQEGDEVTQVLDLIVEWEDGSIILFDNKTSARRYDEDSAGLSQQLVSYYYQNKEQFNLGAVGFIVLSKHLNKNKEKTCSICGKLSDNNRVRTCANEVAGKRCGGEFKEKILPECSIQVIINNVSDAAIELVLSTFDEANQGIKNCNYYKNLMACKNGALICPYMSSCWRGNNEDLVIVEDKSVKT